VLEETGVSSIFGPELGKTVYNVEGVPKIVRYWAAKASDTPYSEPNPGEVDQIEWLPPAEARKKLTLDDDRAIVDSFLRFGIDTTPLILLRHAKALKRSDWDGDDGDRPLDNSGQLQAKRLLPNLFPYQISQIHSSDAMRCLQTVEPFARSLAEQIVISSELSEYRHATDVESALEYAQDLMDEGESALICSHNPILPKLLKKLLGKKNFKKLESGLEPAEAWILHHRDGEVVAIDWMSAPTI
jgi:8-oxo-dGTP diphosphatase